MTPSPKPQFPDAGSRPPRRFISIIVLCLLFIVIAYAVTQPLEDFLAYWTASHLLLKHQNPYSLAEVFHYQKSVGWRQPVPLVALNPPWALPLFAPIGLAHWYPLGWILWVALLTCMVAVSSRFLMDLYFGDIRIPEISDTVTYRSLFALTFYPTLLVLKFAQTTPFVLLGLAGFLLLEKQRKELLAGFVLGLTAIKPNVVFLFWLALLFRSVQLRKWKTIAAGLLTVACLSAIAIWIDPHCFAEYRDLASGPIAYVFTPGMAGTIRTLLGPRNTYWLQFVTPIAGVIWFLFYWRKHHQYWDWIERTPALVTASLLATAWAFLYDQVLLTIAIIALAAEYARRCGRIPRNPVLIYTTLNVALILLAMAASPWSYVPGPILIAVLLYRSARLERTFSEHAQFLPG